MDNMAMTTNLNSQYSTHLNSLSNVSNNTTVTTKNLFNQAFAMFFLDENLSTTNTYAVELKTEYDNLSTSMNKQNNRINNKTNNKIMFIEEQIQIEEQKFLNKDKIYSILKYVIYFLIFALVGVITYSVAEKSGMVVHAKQIINNKINSFNRKNIFSKSNNNNVNLNKSKKLSNLLNKHAN